MAVRYVDVHQEKILIKMTAVSVVIPTFNRADVLPRAINSVLNQTISDLELIIVDDGSTDETTQVVSSYDDERIKYMSFEQNKGANAARTKGIDAARGEYIAFLDSDDEWVDEKLGQQLEALQSTDAAVAYTGIKQVGEDGSVNTVSVPDKSGDITSDLLRGNFIGTYSSIILLAEVLEEVGPPDPELPCWQDWEWYLRLSDENNFVAVTKPLVIRHIEGGQISDNFKHKLDSQPIIWRRMQERASSPAEKKTARANLYFHVGYAALVNQRYSTARSYIFRGIRCRPMTSKFYVYLLFSSPIYLLARKVKRRLLIRENRGY